MDEAGSLHIQYAGSSQDARRKTNFQKGQVLTMTTMTTSLKQLWNQPAYTFEGMLSSSCKNTALALPVDYHFGRIIGEEDTNTKNSKWPRNPWDA